MKLLFDQNLSPRLAGYCKDYFSDSTHLSDIGLDAAEDLIIWNYARSNNYTIVTKDSDFNNIVSLFGFPPKSNLDQKRKLYYPNREYLSRSLFNTLSICHFVCFFHKRCCTNTFQLINHPYSNIDYQRSSSPSLWYP